MKSELELVKSEFDGQANSLEALTAKGSALAKMQETQAKSISTLSSALENSKSLNNEFLDAIEAQRAAIADLEAQMERSGNSFEVFDKETGELRRTVSDATEEIEAMRKELAQLESKQEQAAKSVDGWQIKVNKAQVELNSLNRQVQLNDQYLEEAAAAADQCATSIDSYGRAVKDSTDEAGESTGFLASMLEQTNIASIATGAGLVSMAKQGIQYISQLEEKTREFRNEMAMLQQNATENGVSFLGVTDQLEELYALTGGELDSSVEALSNLLAADFGDDTTAEAVELLSGAIIKFPDTLKIENLADSLQETLATGSATGQYGELLERLGVNLDEFNSAMAAATSTTEKQQVALKYLADAGLAETAAAYKETNEAALEYAKIQFDIQAAEAELLEDLQPLLTALQMIPLVLLTGFDAMIDFFTGGEDATQRVSATVTEYVDPMVARMAELKAQMGELETAYQSVYTAAAASLPGQSSLLEKLEYDFDATVDDVIESLKSKMTYYNSYQINLTKAAANGLNEAALQALSDGSEQSREVVMALGRATQEEIAEVNKYYEYMESAQYRLINTMAENNPTLKAELDELNAEYNAIVTEMSKYDEALKAGENTVQGLVDGLSRGVSAAYDSGVALGNAVTEGYNSALDINSPSRAMMWAAQMTFDPLITEADKAQLELAERSYNMGLSIINNYDAGQQSAGGSGSGYDSMPSTGASAMPSLYETQQPQVNIKFTGSLSQMARIMKPSQDFEGRRVGNRYITGGR